MCLLQKPPCCDGFLLASLVVVAILSSEVTISTCRVLAQVYFIGRIVSIWRTSRWYGPVGIFQVRLAGAYQISVVRMPVPYAILEVCWR